MAIQRQSMALNQTDKLWAGPVTTKSIFIDHQLITTNRVAGYMDSGSWSIGDDEWNGLGNSYDFEARIYDSRVGRWLAMDRYEQFNASQYSGFLNNPILFIEIGFEEYLMKWNGEWSIGRKQLKGSASTLSAETILDIDFYYDKKFGGELKFDTRMYALKAGISWDKKWADGNSLEVTAGISLGSYHFGIDPAFIWDTENKSKAFRTLGSWN